MDDLIKRLRTLAVVKESFTDIADLLEQKDVRIAALEQELRNIANADTVEWVDPTQFEAWAKSRARWTLEKTK